MGADGIPQAWQSPLVQTRGPSPGDVLWFHKVCPDSTYVTGVDGAVGGFISILGPFTCSGGAALGQTHPASGEVLVHDTSAGGYSGLALALGAAPGSSPASAWVFVLTRAASGEEVKLGPDSWTFDPSRIVRLDCPAGMLISGVYGFSSTPWQGEWAGSAHISRLGVVCKPGQ